MVQQLLGDFDRVGLAIAFDLQAGDGLGEALDACQDFDLFVGGV